MTNKEKYQMFCQETYVPIWSKPWWMDAVCGPEHWDVWLFEQGETVLAAMPYYFEMRDSYRYITKATQTQTNGLIFREDSSRKRVSEAEFQEKVIHAACDYLDSLGLDVYEQQYHHTFQNWTPFYWRNFTSIVRYTYVMEDLSDLDAVRAGISTKYRNEIKKGERLTHVSSDVTLDEFYTAYKDIFARKSIHVPISKAFLQSVYQSGLAHESCAMFCARDDQERIHSILFLVWDERAVYQLFGGYMQEFSSSQSYPALMWYGIQFAAKMGRSYDFEGSMIDGVAQSMRQFGGIPKPYYRIRKVYNPEIVRKEAEDYITRLVREQREGE